MTSYRVRLLIAFALIVCTAGSAQANRSQIRHCADDYRRFCSQWGLETRGLENCMRRHGDALRAHRVTREGRPARLIFTHLMRGSVS